MRGGSCFRSALGAGACAGVVVLVEAGGAAGAGATGAAPAAAPHAAQMRKSIAIVGRLAGPRAASTGANLEPGVRCLRALASVSSMTTTDTAALARFLEVFPDWLRTLGQDAAALGQIVEGQPGEEVAHYLTAGLNYIFKSLDLIPDGIDDLGFCDDAFVLRVASALACDAGAAKEGVLGRLADDAKQVEEFLGEDYPKLVTYVQGLRKGAARGRTVDEIMTEPAVRSAFLQEVAAWAKEYQVPALSRDVKTLIKLRAFLNAKLG